MSMPSSDKRTGAGSWLRIAFLFGALTILYLPALSDLVDAWSTKPQYSHGFLVLPVSAFLAWRKRDALRRLPPAPSRGGLALVGLATLGYLLGSVAEASTVCNLTLLANVVGVVWALAGPRAVRVLAFPLFFLLFMFPLPDYVYVAMTNPLKHLVARLSEGILQGVGMAVYREGNILHLPRATLEVVQACSGLRSLVSYVILGVLLAYFLPPGRWGRKALLVVSTLPVALLCNALRVVATAVLSKWFGARAAQGGIHEASGLLLFALGFVLLLAIFRLCLGAPARGNRERRGA